MYTKSSDDDQSPQYPGPCLPHATTQASTRQGQGGGVQSRGAVKSSHIRQQQDGQNGRKQPITTFPQGSKDSNSSHTKRAYAENVGSISAGVQGASKVTGQSVKQPPTGDYSKLTASTKTIAVRLG